MKPKVFIWTLFPATVTVTVAHTAGVEPDPITGGRGRVALVASNGSLVSFNVATRVSS